MSTTTNATANNAVRRQGTARPADKALQPSRDIVNYVREYARQKPDVAALWCFGLGIVVGWKAKPW